MSRAYVPEAPSAGEGAVGSGARREPAEQGASGARGKKGGRKSNGGKKIRKESPRKRPSFRSGPCGCLSRRAPAGKKSDGGGGETASPVDDDGGGEKAGEKGSLPPMPLLLQEFVVWCGRTFEEQWKWKYVEGQDRVLPLSMVKLFEVIFRFLRSFGGAAIEFWGSSTSVDRVSYYTNTENRTI